MPQPVPATTQVLVVGYHCPERTEKHYHRSVGPPKTRETTLLAWGRNTGAWRTPSSDALLDHMAIISCVEMFMGQDDLAGWCSAAGDMETCSSLLTFSQRKPGGLWEVRDSEHNFSSTQALITFCSEPAPRPKGL